MLMIAAAVSTLATCGRPSRLMDQSCLRSLRLSCNTIPRNHLWAWRMLVPNSQECAGMMFAC